MITPCVRWAGVSGFQFIAGGALSLLAEGTPVASVTIVVSIGGIITLIIAVWKARGMFEKMNRRLDLANRNAKKACEAAGVEPDRK